VDPEPRGCRHEVLDGLDARPVHPERGRIVRVHDALGPRRDPFSGRAHLEHDPGVDWRRRQSHPGDFARVKADALDTDGLSNGVLAHRPKPEISNRSATADWGRNYVVTKGSVDSDLLTGGADDTGF